MIAGPNVVHPVLRGLAAVVSAISAYATVRVLLDLRFLPYVGGFGRPTIALALILICMEATILGITFLLIVPGRRAVRGLVVVLLLLAALSSWVSHRAVSHLITMAKSSPHALPTWW